MLEIPISKTPTNPVNRSTMAKKILTLGLYALLTLLLGALLMQVMQRQRIKKHVAEQKQNLPDFVFYNLASSKVTRDSLRHGQSTCIIYLDPDCGFCVAEVTEIVERIDDFGKSDILLVSHVDTARLHRFADETGINHHAKIRLLHDRDYRFADWFGPAVAPSVYIYDSGQRLVKEYRGQTKVDAIIKWL